ncbi:hypothetical protein [Teredinibacter sp. KSP-S5-2]|uniref:hypothetical protein n=1 Tax=Teredinibacter sp. KSP-S5-2 TaxID=3034506 RepID=UPI0029349B3D|nr:hypothetical protein [Teredinibacter sp. KSP-S5-2]WNO09510.1 hypothetical protein P5V12_21465 [Teredinibacter sp. KSP-S5-2]
MEKRFAQFKPYGFISLLTVAFLISGCNTVSIKDDNASNYSVSVDKEIVNRLYVRSFVQKTKAEGSDSSENYYKMENGEWVAKPLDMEIDISIIGASLFYKALDKKHIKAEAELGVTYADVNAKVQGNKIKNKNDELEFYPRFRLITPFSESISLDAYIAGLRQFRGFEWGTTIGYRPIKELEFRLGYFDQDLQFDTELYEHRFTYSGWGMTSTPSSSYEIVDTEVNLDFSGVRLEAMLHF